MITKVEKIEEKTILMEKDSYRKNYKTFKFLTTTWYVLWFIPVFKRVEIL